MEKTSKSKRILKIQSNYQNRSFHKITTVPEIRLLGKWLKDSGFEEGKHVSIEVEEQKITIRLVKD